MIDQRLADAQHEAAHVVVGLALGLTLKKATIDPGRRDRKEGIVGYAWFRRTKRHEAFAIMAAAGIAWDRLLGADPFDSSGDRELIQEYFTDEAIEPFTIAATAILETRQAAHARVTRALLDGPVTPKTLARMMQGKRT